ncbi:hypothetical protein [Saccharopolyspora pogona]|uniref:hypothetical protein n=1 Tax=Saccharopolyspora pogona TaxID=333966 RepID=UPI001686869B|nr:hypothetical protein [Saccharopolyspora pogona]
MTNLTARHAASLVAEALALPGPLAVRPIAEQAGHDVAARARGLALARCDTLIRLDDGLNGDDDSPEPLLRNQLARAWQPTPLDDGNRARSG